MLEESLGKVDVFELRPMIGFASTAMARKIPRNETVLDVVLTAAYSVTGRWNEEYEEIDLRRAAARAQGVGARGLRRAPLRQPLRRRAEARADRALGHDRPRTPAARRARREPRPRCPRGARRAARRVRLFARVARDRHGHAPRRGDPARLHARHAARRTARSSPPGRLAEALTSETLTETFGITIDLTETDGRFAARAA